MPIYLPSAFCAGVLLSFALPAAPPFWLFAVWAACAVPILRRFPRTAVFVLLTCAGTAYGVWRTEQALAARWPLERQGEAVEMTVRAAGLAQDDGRRVRLEAEAETAGGRRYRVQLSDYQRREWPAGSVWRLKLKMRPPIGEENIGGFSREAWALANGIDASATAGAERQLLADRKNGFSDGLLRLRGNIRSSWQRLPPEVADGAALMRALSIGEQDALSGGWWQVFRPLGLNHLISVSGLHVGMVALLAAWLMKRLLLRLPAAPRRPRVWMLAAGAAAALVYSGLAGFAVPTLRSMLMIASVAAAWSLGGTASAWRGWWAALALILLLDPSAALAAGSWLSFGLVAALLWADSCRTGDGKAWWVSALRGQWAATLASFPAVGFLFSALPPASPLANAAAIPWFSWLLVPLALIASLFPFYPLQYAAAWLGQHTLHVLAAMAEFAPEWGLAAAPWPLLLSALAAVAVWLLPRGAALRPWATIVLTGFLLYRPAPPTEGRLKMVVLDVGQGLAVYFQTASHHLLFDTGTAGAAQMQTLPALHAHGVRRLDTLLLSHHDTDHDGGAPLIIRALKPREVLAGQPEFYGGLGPTQVQNCRTGRQWEWDGVHFELLAVEGEAADDNARSCVLRAVAGGTAFIVTGDLDIKGERKLLERYGQSLYSQALVLGHHGSSGSSSGAFLNAVSPDFAIASSGFGNSYRHPTAEVQNRVRAHGVRLLRTDRQGAWLLESDGQTVTARQWRPKRFYWQWKPLDD